MLDAQRTTRETRRAFVTARAEYWRSLCRYNASLGRRIIP
jgi:outer membrane protein TolC